MARNERLTSYRRDALTFDVIDSGPMDGEPVALLHGFPQRAGAWAKVAPLLHAEGLRTYAPDQRGYSPGARPRGRAAYTLEKLVDDVAALIKAVGGPVHLVGHDWGATVAWTVAGNLPNQVRSLTAVSTGHPRAFLRALRRFDQARRSSYMAFIPLPALPERLLATPRVASWFLRRSGMSDEMLRTYQREIVDDGALRGGLDWYRALPMSTVGAPRVRVPTTFVWSDGDVALGRTMADLTSEYVTGPYEFVELAGASHWIPEERPDELATAIIRRASTSVP